MYDANFVSNFFILESRKKSLSKIRSLFAILMLVVGLKVLFLSQIPEDNLTRLIGHNSELLKYNKTPPDSKLQESESNSSFEIEPLAVSGF